MFSFSIFSMFKLLFHCKKVSEENNKNWVYYSFRGQLWSWSYGSCIYNYLCNQCLSPLRLWVWILLRQGVLNTTLYDKVCQWLVTGRWFSLGTPVSSTNKTDCYYITEIYWKWCYKLNTITLIPIPLGNTNLSLVVECCTHTCFWVSWGNC
jgi:hypothetical protein